MLDMYLRCRLLEKGCSVYAFLGMCLPPFYIRGGFFYHSGTILVSILDISTFRRGVIQRRSLTARLFATCDSCNIYRSQSAICSYLWFIIAILVIVRYFSPPVDRKYRYRDTSNVLLCVPLLSSLRCQNEFPILPLFFILHDQILSQILSRTGLLDDSKRPPIVL